MQKLLGVLRNINFDMSLNFSFVEHNGHPGSETKLIAENGVEHESVGGQRFPWFDRFVNGVERAVKKVLVFVPSTSICDKPRCIMIRSVEEIYRLPGLLAPQRSHNL